MISHKTKKWSCKLFRKRHLNLSNNVTHIITKPYACEGIKDTKMNLLNLVESKQIHCIVLCTLLWTINSGKFRLPISHHQGHKYTGMYAYSIQHTVYSTQYTAYSLQYTAYSILYTVYRIKYTVYSIQYTVYSIQHTAYSIQSCSWPVRMRLVVHERQRL